MGVLLALLHLRCEALLLVINYNLVLGNILHESRVMRDHPRLPHKLSLVMCRFGMRLGCEALIRLLGCLKVLVGCA